MLSRTFDKSKDQLIMTTKKGLVIDEDKNDFIYTYCRIVYQIAYFIKMPKAIITFRIRF
jgi:hypothetical protein